MTEPQLNSAGEHEPALTAKETREIVTPYAFGVADELLGQPLATPLRRLLAQCIDVSIVILLSSAHALVLAIFAAVTFFRAGKHLAEGQQQRSLARKMLRLSGAFLFFFVTYWLVNAYHSEPTEYELSRDSAIVSGTLNVIQKYAWQDCNELFSCYERLAAGSGEVYASTTDTKEEAISAFNTFLADKNLSDEQVIALQKVFTDSFNAEKSNESDNRPQQLQQEIRESIIGSAIKDSIDAAADAEQKAMAVLGQPPASDAETQPATEPDSSESANTTPVAKPDNSVEASNEPTLTIGLGKDNDTEKSNSLIRWVDGLIKDLGLGFGWAALYYSVLTAWWRGHTIGKRVLRIKVVKLDGSSLNLWESFGRYGGYGAGLATGLLGFFQVFWDPNRQTIQDKIAETLVLYRPVGATPIPELVNQAVEEPVSP